jgi:hypothetical protein
MLPVGDLVTEELTSQYCAVLRSLKLLKMGKIVA